MKQFLKLIKASRNELRKNRNKFWGKNKRDFSKNILRIINSQKLPKKFKIYVVASNFINKKNIMPYDWDSWSSTALIGATKKQEFELMMFFNRARSEFLSLPALIPLVAHELYHVKQASRSPKKFLMSVINDKFSKEIEKEADSKIKNIEEFRKEKILEMILYCYDIKGWSSAKKMADYLYKHHKKMYGGGYSSEMTIKEYKLFLKSMKTGNINLFINSF